MTELASTSPQAEVAALRSELAELRSRSGASAAALHEQLTTLHVRYREQLEALDESRRARQAAEVEQAAARADLAVQQDEANGARQRIEQLEARLKDAQVAVQSLTAQSAALQTELKALRDQYAAAYAQVVQARDSAEALAEAGAMARLSLAEAQSSRLNNRVTRLLKDNDAAKAYAAELAAETQGLRTRVKALADSNAALETQLATASRERDEWHEKFQAEWHEKIKLANALEAQGPGEPRGSSE